MEVWLWCAIGVLLLVTVFLIVKILLLQKSADEIRLAFSDRLVNDTNTLIDISSHDRHMLLLACSVNNELRHLRAERQRFVQGDTELKEAVTNIAHDLRTPLTAVSGYLQLLEREEKSEAVKRYLDLIGNRTDTLKTLTEELFRYSVITSRSELKMTCVDVVAVLEESLAGAYDQLSQKGIVPDIILPENKVERISDRSALSRIFENIISNAVKYSDGDFTVKMNEDESIVFKNSSKGLDSVTVERLFDRFYTVETGRNSTGLGLSIAKLLTERMGGTINATYADGTLTITLRL